MREEMKQIFFWTMDDISKEGQQKRHPIYCNQPWSTKETYNILQQTLLVLYIVNFNTKNVFHHSAASLDIFFIIF